MSPFTGPVTRIFVALGQPVAKGQPLALVASADFAAAIGTYRKAAVTAANARTARAPPTAILPRTTAFPSARRRKPKPMLRAPMPTATPRCRRWSRWASIAARSPEHGRAARQRVGGIIRAPVSGVVVDKQITPGQLLQAGSSPAFTVANLSQMWVLAQIAPSDLAAGRRPRCRADRSGERHRALHGTVDNISASVDPNTRAVVARIVAPNPGDLLKKQMYVDVSIESGRVSTGLLVPVSAVLRDDENLPFVYVALPDGSFARRHVTLGYRDSQNYDVTSGLQAGDRVVADGAHLPAVHAEPMSDEPADAAGERLVLHQPDRRASASSSESSSPC